MKRTQGQFKKALQIQLEFIENSCALYDNGHKNEAIRIATAICTILMEKGHASIVKHILGNQKDDLCLLSTNTTLMDTIPKINPQDFPSFTLTPAGKFPSESTFYNLLSYADGMPFLDCKNINCVNPGEMKVNDWLKQKVVSLDLEDRTYYPITRTDLISIARDKDGGSHLDRSISDQAYNLLRDGIDIATSQTGETINTRNLHLASLRQLGYEILNSKSLKDLCA